MKTNTKHITILLGIFSFLTLPLISQVNYYFNDGFESITDFANWQQEEISGTSTWTLESGLPYGNYDQSFEGQTNACFKSYNYDNNQTMLSSPSIDLSQSENPILKFKLLIPKWGLDQDILKVYYKTEANNNWILLNTYNYNIDIWTDILLPLPDASETYQISFLAESQYGYGIGIDNVSIIDGESCGMIDNFNFINIKESSILVSWDDQSDNTYEIEYGSLDYTLGNGQRISNITSKTAQINNLNQGEFYSLYIRTYCKNGISEWNGPYEFYTECSIGQQIPYTESFENTEGAIECWNIVYPSTESNPDNQVIVSNENAFTGQNSLRFSSYEVGSPYDQYLISPNLISTDTLELSFRYRTISGSQETFEVGLSNSSENPLSNIIWNDSITDANEEWKIYKTLIIPGTTNFVIHYNSIYEYYLYVDDIRLNYPGQCDIIENFDINNITENSATLTWEGEANEYKLEYGFANFAKGNGNILSEIIGNSVVLTDLIPEVEYTAYIITQCGGVDLYSDPIFFTTLNSSSCNAVSEIFTDSISDNFARINWINETGNTKWNLEFGISGFTQGEGIIVEDILENTFDAKDLESNQEYDIYIQAMCEQSSELTDWSEKHTFKTQPSEVFEDNNDLLSENIPSITLNAKDSIIYICDNTSNNILDADLELINTGNIQINKGTKISYSLEFKSQNTILNLETILPYNLNPNETYSFTNQVDITNLDEIDNLSIKITSKWSLNSDLSDNIKIILVSNDLNFENENNGIIEVSQLPELISAEYNSNINQNQIDYIWTDNIIGNSRFIENEGTYTLMVSTEHCQISKSISIIQKDNDNLDDFEIYPNPSQDGQINIVNNSETSVNITIYDAAGRSVFEENLSQITKQVDLRHLASGIYNVAFIKDNNVELKRLYID